MALSISVIVCAHNEAQYLPACLHSLLSQSRIPDEILVINNASTDTTRAVAEQIPHVRVVDEPRKGLVVARETGRLIATSEIIVYLDADCRAPLMWLERIERRFTADPLLIALSGPYRFYDWDWWGRLLIRAYDVTLAPATQLLVKYVLRIGTIFYGGNFAVRRSALERIGGFDTSIEFHGEDTNVGRRLFAIGRVSLFQDCYLYTSARRYIAMGKGAVFRLYVRNFTSELGAAFAYRPPPVGRFLMGRPERGRQTVECLGAAMRCASVGAICAEERIARIVTGIHPGGQQPRDRRHPRACAHGEHSTFETTNQIEGQRDACESCNGCKPDESVTHKTSVLTARGRRAPRTHSAIAPCFLKR